MKKAGIAAIVAAGVVILGGGGYALGTLTSSEPEPAAIQTPTEPAATIEDTAPEPEAAPELEPADVFLDKVEARIEDRGLSYSTEKLHTVGQDICDYYASGNAEPYQTVDSAQDIERDTYMDLWDAALFTDGYCD